jgi:peptidoglycan/xylan/chitin deacetylase (PgdA/CDA1 family)
VRIARSPHQSPGTLVPVLVYHSVNDTPVPGQERWTVPRRSFADHRAVIRGSGRTPLLVSELAGCLRAARPLPPRPVAITLDDGFADNLDAVGDLAADGLSATVFVTSGYVGAAGMLTPHQVGQLASMPSVELGAHSVSHAGMDEIDTAAVKREILGSRERLEQLASRPVTSFAYPHGFHTARVRAEVVRAGFSAAAAVKNALSHAHDDPFAIARWIVTSETPARRVDEFLDGVGFPTAWSRERLLTRGYRASRRARRLVRAPLA